MSTRVLEQIEVFTPLGLRFWDVVHDRAIVEGLRVRAWPASRPSQISSATHTRSGVFTFRWLPGMRPVEHRYDDPEFFDASVPGRREFIVNVDDTRERYLPVAFTVELPLPYRGVFLTGGEGSSPPRDSPPGVHLFSAPTRVAGERATAVRGTLVDADSGQPAAWAVVRVAAPHGRLFHGIADERGRFVVMFPFPSFAEGFGGSPANLGAGAPMGERGWDLTLTVFYEPGRLTQLAGTQIPEYRSVLDQAQAGLWSLTPSPSDVPQAQLPLRMSFGQPLVLRTGGTAVQLVSAAPASP